MLTSINNKLTPVITLIISNNYFAMYFPFIKQGSQALNIKYLSALLQSSQSNFPSVLLTTCISHCFCLSTLVIIIPLSFSISIKFSYYSKSQRVIHNSVRVNVWLHLHSGISPHCYPLQVFGSKTVGDLRHTLTITLFKNH